MENNERKAKNSEARIRANNKYKKANYKQIKIEIRPEQAEIIRNTAKQLDISIAQLIINELISIGQPSRMNNAYQKISYAANAIGRRNRNKNY